MCPHVSGNVKHYRLARAVFATRGVVYEVVDRNPTTKTLLAQRIFEHAKIFEPSQAVAGPEVLRDLAQSHK
jgi:hypothetical protein